MGVGCRKALGPVADRNQAPETYITAAPQDTITLRDAAGRPIVTPTPGKIPVRFHLYWAGADPDGEVTGFYFAVVETLPYALPGQRRPPQLPGPRARDYKYTTRTDSTFIFNVSESSADREHAFFIYAVDNQGKGDPTPARFIFDAQDQYPPAIYVDEASATANVFEQAPNWTVVLRPRVYTVTDTLNPATVVKDTVPSSGVLNFRWHGEPTLAGSIISGYRYRLDETQFVVTDSSVHVKTYNSGIADHLAPGSKVFTLRAVDQAGGARQTTRRFQLNFSPITWFSGPDVNAYPYATGPDGSRYTTVTTFSPPPTLPGSLLSSDSVTKLPSERPERKTFFEIYKNFIYVRSENDTVNMNSWVILSSGGFDRDSPYLVKISSADPSLPDTTGLPPGAAKVLRPGGPNGSPIGFRSILVMEVTPRENRSEPSPSTLYPLFDPADSQRLLAINSVWGAFQAGKAYAVVRAEDGDGRSAGGFDNSVPDPVGLARAVDSGAGTAYQQELRKRVLTFYVDKAPYLKTTTPGFKPAPKPPYTVYATRSLDVNLPAGDDDPYDAAALPRRGGPSASTILQWYIRFRGVSVATGADTVYAPDFLNPTSLQQASGIQLPSWLGGTDITVEVELCDCKDCQGPSAIPARGRCVITTFPVTVPPPPTPASPTSFVPTDSPRPESSIATGRSEAP